MKLNLFAKKHPLFFSFLIIFIFFLMNGIGVFIAQRRGLSPTSYSLYIEIGLAIFFSGIVSSMRWWKKIGFKKPDQSRHLLLYLPSLALILGNLTFGIHITALPMLLVYLVTALLSGFVEETAFRGLILQAFTGRGPVYAAVASSLLFGLTHIFNVLAGGDPIYVVVQILYALAIGFGFGAMVIRGGMIWPVILGHGLGNFVAFINSDSATLTGAKVDSQVIIISVLYIVLFTSYGLFLLRGFTRKTNQPCRKVISLR